jgi:hypothetical protein
MACMNLALRLVRFSGMEEVEGAGKMTIIV